MDPWRLRYAPRAETPRAATPARVPREACQTPTLRQKLKGFALKPLIWSNSQKRSEKVREEIEQRQCITEAKGLWSDTSFAFVAETKAKTIQLRHRTMALLQKIDSYEKMPLPPDKPDEIATNIAEEADSFEQKSEQPALRISVLRQATDDLKRHADGENPATNSPNSGGASPHRAKMRSLKSSIRASVLQEALHRNQADQLLDLVAKRQAHTDLNAHDKQLLLEAVMQESDSPRKKKKMPTGDTKTIDDEKPTGDSRDSSKEKETEQEKASPRSRFEDGMTGFASIKEEPATHSSPQLAKAANVENSAKSPERRPSTTPGGKRRLSRQFLRGQSARKFKGSGRPSPRPLKGNQKVMCEEQRELKLVDDSVSFPAACIRIIADKSLGGGVRIEVICPPSTSKAPQPKVRGRELTDSELERLTELGKSAPTTEQYQWLCGTVSLKAEPQDCARCGETLTPGVITCPSCGVRADGLGEFNIALVGFDTDHYFADDDQSFCASASVKRELTLSFQRHTSLLKQRSDFVEDIAKKRPRSSMLETSRQKDLEAVSQRCKMYLGAVEALHDLFLKFDFSGDGRIDEQEFSIFLCGVMSASGQPTPDAQEIKRYWKDLRSHSEKLVFTQVVDFLISKFPKLQSMTAFEVTRFSNKARRFVDENGEGEKTFAWQLSGEAR